MLFGNWRRILEVSVLCGLIFGISEDSWVKGLFSMAICILLFIALGNKLSLRLYVWLRSRSLGVRATIVVALAAVPAVILAKLNSDWMSGLLAGLILLVYLIDATRHRKETPSTRSFR